MKKLKFLGAFLLFVGLSLLPLSVTEQGEVRLERGLWRTKVVHLPSGRSCWKPPMVSFDLGDLHGDGVPEVAAVYGSFFFGKGGRWEIFSLDESFSSVISRDFTKFSPFKVRLGDVTGDGVEELALGIFKETPLHRFRDRRCFFYNVREGKLIPRFRASRFVRPFLDFELYDLDGDDILEVVSLERTEDGRCILGAYRWNGFGFSLEYESAVFDSRGKFRRDRKLYLDEEEVVLEQGILMRRK